MPRELTVPELAQMDARRDEYHAFLRAKKSIAKASGIEVDPGLSNPLLKEFTQEISRWMVGGGRRAFFGRYGLHKTCTSLEVLRLHGLFSSDLRLQIIPLGVRQEFFRDAKTFFQGDHEIRLKFIKRAEEIEDERTIYLTNYETIREGLLAPDLFGQVSLDEADILRSFGSETFGEFLFGPMMRVANRYVFTATPEPNRLLELIAYAHFLGVMDMGEAKTRFFKRNSEKADDLTLMPHMEEEFRLWVHSWGLVMERPSDLGYSDDGYILPPIDFHWHEVESDHTTAKPTKQGQMRMLKDAALGTSEAAAEKRECMPARLAKLMEIREEDPFAHRILWHSLEDERRALEKMVPGIVTICGSQKLEDREASVIAFSDGEIQEFGTKPELSGSGCNFQRHCSWEIFLGVDYKAKNFMQAVHRIHRFGQKNACRVDVIHSEAERVVVEELKRKIGEHNDFVAKQAAITREHRLSTELASARLERAMGVQRRERRGKNWVSINNDSVEELWQTPDEIMGMWLTSIPFSNQYEYTPSYNDFGHTDDASHFWRQMDFMTPELHRTLKPGRVLAVHVKDRIVDGAITGYSFPTTHPFHAEALAHYMKHGFVFMGMITISTDVVRENNGSYRLGYTMMCNDSSRMGAGMSEYLLVFRKLPTDHANGFADQKVGRQKSDYGLPRWQIDAHGFWRSDGNRYLAFHEYARLPKRQIWRIFKEAQMGPYDYEWHCKVAEALEESGRLPRDYMIVPAQSQDPWVWSDVVRMRSLNSSQAAKGREKHICPFPEDICKRAIERWSMPGDLVGDPFSGLGTTFSEAVKLGRYGWGCELNAGYWADSCGYGAAADAKVSTPRLLDLDELEVEADMPPELAA